MRWKCLLWQMFIQWHGTNILQEANFADQRPASVSVTAVSM